MLQNELFWVRVIREVFVEEIRTFGQVLKDRILKAFVNIEQEAEKLVTAVFFFISVMKIAKGYPPIYWWEEFGFTSCFCINLYPQVFFVICSFLVLGYFLQFKGLIG